MSLGWCTESVILPRRPKEIHGVSGATMVELRAAVFQAQRNRGQRKSSAPAPTLKPIATVLKNRGVDERAQRDYQQQQQAKDHKAALEAKASRYEKLERAGFYDDSADCLVDFERKAAARMEEDEDSDAEPVPEGGDGRREWDREDEYDEDAEQLRRDRKRELLKEVTDETRYARERVRTLRDQKKQRLLRKLEMLQERKKLREMAKEKERQEQVEKQMERDAAPSESSSSSESDESGSASEDESENKSKRRKPEPETPEPPAVTQSSSGEANSVPPSA
eukprot:TRINITY_DN82751_c0_g1_i1.p1 TRINITY_DN82751_c0_g1~~TRINITY_DN82751_c0_g1_i1.p1  ORF type:complete len:289 (-),score=61.76 TRINITY_DN82751_c0_g1_i1:52-888(-)